MAGGDIGTVVLPDADLKVYLEASREERARRRCRQLAEKGSPASFESVLEDLDRRDRRVVFMAKDEMFHWPIFGLYVRLIGAFPVRRLEADLKALRRAVQVVRRGEVLVMFPEGTRSKTGSMSQGPPGTAMGG